MRLCSHLLKKFLEKSIVSSAVIWQRATLVVWKKPWEKIEGVAHYSPACIYLFKVNNRACNPPPSSLGEGGGGVKISEKSLLGELEIFILVGGLYCLGGNNFVGGSHNF